jgi:hypothetical protein
MHRVVGRVYITGVFILAPLGAYIEHLEERIGGIFRLEDNVAASDTVFRSCLVLAIPLADLVLQLQESRRARTAAAN